MVRRHFGSMGYLSAFLSGAAPWRILLCASDLGFPAAIRPGQDSSRISRARRPVDAIDVVNLGITPFARPIVETFAGCGTDCWHLEAAPDQRRRALPFALKHRTAAAKLVCPSRA
jgi:hypothetical protein